MVTGQCLCGTVRWRADGPLDPLRHCHCSMCRKAHGAAFATTTACRTDAFRWLSGADAIATYQSTAGRRRAFCRICGSALPSEIPAEGRMALPAGGIDGNPGLAGGQRVFAASKAPWHVIADRVDPHAPGLSAGPGSPEGPAPDPAAPGVQDLTASPEPLRGGCLCGAVAFEVTPPFRMVFNCHCSRCRRARAAAHTTNGFVAAGAIRFLRGEDDIETYKLPGAQTFSQAFCRHCGSGMPRVVPEADRAVIPFGALDDDPGRCADAHIFTGSKAPWYEIADAIPQFEERPTRTR